MKFLKKCICVADHNNTLVWKKRLTFFDAEFCYQLSSFHTFNLYEVKTKTECFYLLIHKNPFLGNFRANAINFKNF